MKEEIKNANRNVFNKSQPLENSPPARGQKLIKWAHVVFNILMIVGIFVVFIVEPRGGSIGGGLGFIALLIICILGNGLIALLSIFISLFD